MRRAQDNYQLVKNKLNEAQLKSATSYSAQSMQVVAPALRPLSADSRRVQMQMVLSGLGGLVAGLVAAFLLDVVVRKPVVQRVVRRMLPSLSGLAGLVVGVLIAVLIRAIAPN